MEKSEVIVELVRALIKAQNEFKPLIRDKQNPFYKSNYATLDSVHKSTCEALKKHGLAIIQFMDGNELVSMLTHISGQYISGKYPINPVKNDPQGIGSAITYARRYSYCAMLQIAPDEDDDGNAGSNGNNKKEKKPEEKPEIKMTADEARKRFEELPERITGFFQVMNYGEPEMFDFCKRHNWNHESMLKEVNGI